MTSEERHEARYRRRLAERQRRREERSRACGTFEEVFSFQNLYKAGKLCCKGVGWKGSTQRYLGDIISNTAKTRKALMEGKWKTKGFHEFDLMERGKLRHIRSVHISERVVQRCLCDNVLVPVFSAAFIYDNAASLKDKGIDFAMDRMNCHLQRHVRKHGLKGGILVYDFSDYFNSAPHGPIYRENERRITDGRVRAVANGLMEDFGPVGFGLGSQVSQIDALMLPNGLDHFIKEELRIRGCWPLHGRRVSHSRGRGVPEDLPGGGADQVPGAGHPHEPEEDPHREAGRGAVPEDQIPGDTDRAGDTEDAPEERPENAGEAEEVPPVGGRRHHDTGGCPHGIRELARPHEAREQLEGAAADGQVLSEALRERRLEGQPCMKSGRTGRCWP